MRRLLLLFLLLPIPTFAQISGNPVCFVERQTGQTLPSGLWRMCVGRVSANTWSVERNIDATGAFGVVATVISATGTTVTMPQGGLTVGVASATGGTVTIAGSSSGAVSQNSTTGTWTFTWPTSGGTNAYPLTTNGSGVGSWSQLTSAGLNITTTSCGGNQAITAISGGGVGTCTATSSSTTYSAQNANFNAASNTAYFITANGVTATLPASPADNDWIIFVDGATVTAGTTTIGRNGKNIMGSAANLVMDVAHFNIKLVYKSGTTDWRVAN